jgi:hypothetical protein
VERAQRAAQTRQTTHRTREVRALPIDVEVVREWVVAREGSVGGWDLAATGHAEFLAEDVGVRFRSAGRNAEPGADFVVRATCRDQDHDLALAVGQLGRVAYDVVHGAGAKHPPARPTIVR